MTIFFWDRKKRAYAHNTAGTLEGAVKALETPQRKKPITLTKIKEDEFRTNTPYDLHLGQVTYYPGRHKARIRFRGKIYDFPPL